MGLGRRIGAVGSDHRLTRRVVSPPTILLAAKAGPLRPDGALVIFAGGLLPSSEIDRASVRFGLCAFSPGSSTSFPCLAHSSYVSCP